jgi:peptidoglycan/xylan/chitin deacetylase (PgdA/CDA1 family)
MKSTVFRSSCAFAVLTILLASTALANDTTKKISISFDDLPYVANSTPFPEGLPDTQRATSGILKAIKKYNLPTAGFVNEGKLFVTNEVDERIALLQQWIDTGAILGNHSFGHLDLNIASAAEFEEAIVKSDIVSKIVMHRRAPYQLYFRYPYNHTGDTEEKKKEVERFLSARGYRVARHTIDSEDYVFNKAETYIG